MKTSDTGVRGKQHPSESDVVRVSFKKNDNDVCFGDVTLDDPAYVKKSAELIRDVLSDSGSVMHLSDGGVLATKTTLITVLYRWDSVKKRFYRTKTGAAGVHKMPRGSRKMTSKREQVVELA